MDDQQNTELIEKAVNGDARAFETLVNAYYPVMFKMSYSWCGNRQDAQDITQEACIRLGKGIDSFKGDSAFTSWLYRLTINTAKNWVKSQGRHASGSDGLESVAIEGDSEDKTYANEVLQAVYALPDGEKEALLLVLQEGLSHREAAEILDCSESTVSWRIHEARKKLGAQFKEQNYG